MKKPPFQTEMFALIERELGVNNVIAVPSAFLAFRGGDTAEAIFLAQLIYWTGREKREDGFIFKTKSEWEAETGIRRHTLDRLIRELKKDGFLKTTLKQANGNPTIHYKLDRKAFIDAFSRFLPKAKDAICRNQPIEKLKSTNGLVENSDSITENTTYPTSEPTLKSDKGAKLDSVRTSPLSFSTYKKKYNVDDVTTEAIEFFLKRYKAYQGEEHPRLRPSQWSTGIENMQTGMTDGLDLDGWKILIARYFKTQFEADYRFSHFSTPGVLEISFYDSGLY